MTKLTLPLEVGKTYVCRNGDKVRVLATDRDCKDGFSVVVMELRKNAQIETNLPNGKWDTGTEDYGADIVADYVPMKTVWCNVYCEAGIYKLGYPYGTEEVAKMNSNLTKHRPYVTTVSFEVPA